MKVYRRLMALALTLMALVFLAANGILMREGSSSSRAYRVEISRAAEDIRENGYENLDLSLYPSLIRVEKGQAADGAFLKGGGEDCALRMIGEDCYRFDYQPAEEGSGRLLLTVNLCLGAAAAVLLGTMAVIAHQVIRPFEQIRELPVSLAKGNLTMPVLQQKNRHLGKFLWGMDLLREKLESQKGQELKLQKEKKSLVLSLTHDIKTPLSAIKLYSQALGRNLYRDPEKQKEIAGNIGAKVDEIESYLSQIVSASREDFLHLEVSNGEFYLADVMQELEKYYKDKLALLKIPFSVDFGGNCMLKGDRDRTVEVFQNLMENAIKYGGGGAISIRSGEEGNCRILTVSNENCSLDQQELPHIFDSFWRGANGGKVQGSGLGLYICRQLMNAMGGEIFAEIRGGNMEVSLVFEKA